MSAQSQSSMTMTMAMAVTHHDHDSHSYSHFPLFIYISIVRFGQNSTSTKLSNGALAEASATGQIKKVFSV